MPGELEAQRARLRELSVRITWDGETEPAVWSPISDFFGSGLGPVRQRTLPCGLCDDGTWYSFWYMPFATGARVELENDSTRAVSLDWEITHTPLTDYGMVQLKIDDKKWGPVVDNYHSTVKPRGDSFEVVHLEAGPHVLGIEVIGRNPAAKGFHFGLDYIKLVPAF